MREMAEVRNLDVAKCQKEDSDRMDAVVVFEDPTLMNDVFFKISDINCTYTVEVAPPLNSVIERYLTNFGLFLFTNCKT